MHHNRQCKWNEIESRTVNNEIERYDRVDRYRTWPHSVQCDDRDFSIPRLWVHTMNRTCSVIQNNHFEILIWWWRFKFPQKKIVLPWNLNKSQIGFAIKIKLRSIIWIFATIPIAENLWYEYNEVIMYSSGQAWSVFPLFGPRTVRESLLNWLFVCVKHVWNTIYLIYRPIHTQTCHVYLMRNTYRVEHTYARGIIFGENITLVGLYMLYCIHIMCVVYRFRFKLCPLFERGPFSFALFSQTAIYAFAACLLPFNSNILHTQPSSENSNTIPCRNR